MKDIAELAGCSVMTVSKALRDSPKVSAARKAEILSLARAHGYSPNPLVSALVAHRHNRHTEAGTIALLTKFDKPVRSWKTRQPVYSDLLDGIDQRAKELGFKVEEFATCLPGAPDGARLTNILRARGIVGLMLFPGGGFERTFPELEWKHFSTVAILFNAMGIHVHRTASDYALGMDMCLNELQRSGYKRIGLAMTRFLDPSVSFFFSGRFFSWQNQQPDSQRVPLISGVSERADFETFADWIKNHQPDCILAYYPYMDEWLRKIGLVPGKDIGYVNLALRGRTDATGLEMHPKRVGASSINLLSRELFLNHRGLPEAPETTLISPLWFQGPTTRQPLA
jgi:DNA-binding LacI/PurR family transcriptional regulator